MKKSITLLGVFALLVAAPSFAQEKSVENSQTTTVKPVTIEKKEATATKKVVKIQKQDLRTIKLKEAQEIKSVEPKVIKEDN